MTSPKISVIIIYKNKKNLYDCIESMVQQSFSNIEVICVNNGSKDGAEKTAQELSKKIDRIKLISLPSRLEDNEAKHAGLAAAAGEFVIFIENNETVSADFIKNVYLAAQKKNKIELKNKYLYRRSFLENDKEIAALIEAAAKSETEVQKQDIQKEFDNFEKNTAENISGREYNIMTRFNALEKEVYDKDFQIKKRMEEFENLSKTESNEKFNNLYRDIDKVYEYINSEINKKGSEINAVYDEISKNYKYTEELVKNNTAAPDTDFERFEKIENRLKELEKEIITRYVNLKRIMDLQFDEINQRQEH